MKRFLFTMALVAAIVSVAFYYMPRDLQDCIETDENTACFVYCRSACVPAESLGYGYIVKCNGENLEKTLQSCDEIDGISFSFTATERQFEKLVKDMDFSYFNSQKLGELVIISGYSPKIRGGVTCDGSKLNLQIAYGNGVVSIGSPLLLGSY